MNELEVESPAALPAASLRVAGQHARAVQRGYVNRALAGLGIAFAVLIASFAIFGLGWITFALEMTVIASMLAMEKVAMPVIERWGRGAAGEELVGRVLAELVDDGWFALHDISFGRGNIDHIIVGPAGIFTIETKSHRGRISVDKLHHSMLRQAYAEAKVLERITGLQVQPLLVFSQAYLLPAVSRQKGVVVLPARMLAGHLERRNGKIPIERVSEVYGRLAAALPG